MALGGSIVMRPVPRRGSSVMCASWAIFAASAAEPFALPFERGGVGDAVPRGTMRLVRKTYLRC